MKMKIARTTVEAQGREREGGAGSVRRCEESKKKKGNEKVDRPTAMMTMMPTAKSLFEGVKMLPLLRACSR